MQNQQRKEKQKSERHSTFSANERVPIRGFRDTGYLGEKLIGYGIFRADKTGYRVG
jgi:hypothetical protein